MFDRRTFLAGAAALLASGCTTGGFMPRLSPARPLMLMPETDEPFPVAAVDLSQVHPQFHRQIVRDPTGERPGTIVVDPGARFLYLVLEDGEAMRYGIGVGREGFGWNGRAVIRRKAKWPTWTPPRQMIAREPRLAEYASGMPGGPRNPLGARALYLYQGGRDTLYRIHGTNEAWSIGRAVSSGCIRLFNADIIDLYGRVPVGTPVIVRPARRGFRI